MNPEVSVIITAYNTETYIAQAIESALGQTEENLEVILVDNASTDDTGKIARGFVDKRLKILVNQKNLGVSAALNRALREAKGKWVTRLDSDDWYAPQRLEKLLQVAYAEDADMVADDLYLIQDGKKHPWSTLLSESGERVEKIKQIDPAYFVETDVYGQKGLHLGLSIPLFKRDFLVQHGIEYDENLLRSPDFWLDVKCLAHGARFFLVPEPYYFHRFRQGSITAGSKVKHINEFSRANLYYLQQECVKKNSALVSALSKHQTLIEKTIPYYRVIDRLKERELLAGLIEMVRNPYFFLHFIMQLPGILSRRLRYCFSRITINNENNYKQKITLFHLLKAVSEKQLLNINKTS